MGSRGGRAVSRKIATLCASPAQSRIRMSPEQASHHSMRRIIVASFIGTSIEWYDFFLYGTAAALVFNRLFFPTFDAMAGTMAAFTTYAVGFFARPIGGVIFG